MKPFIESLSSSSSSSLRRLPASGRIVGFAGEGAAGNLGEYAAGKAGEVLGDPTAFGKAGIDTSDF